MAARWSGSTPTKLCRCRPRHHNHYRSRSVDLRGNPMLRSKWGGWTACAAVDEFAHANNIIERLNDFSNIRAVNLSDTDDEIISAIAALLHPPIAHISCCVGYFPFFIPVSVTSSHFSDMFFFLSFHFARHLVHSPYYPADFLLTVAFYRNCPARSLKASVSPECMYHSELRICSWIHTVVFQYLHLISMHHRGSEISCPVFPQRTWLIAKLFREERGSTRRGKDTDLVILTHDTRTILLEYLNLTVLVVQFAQSKNKFNKAIKQTVEHLKDIQYSQGIRGGSALAGYVAEQDRKCRGAPGTDEAARAQPQDFTHRPGYILGDNMMVRRRQEAGMYRWVSGVSGGHI